MRRRTGLAVFVLTGMLFCLAGLAEDGRPARRVGILSAMENEVRLLLSEAEIERVDAVGGVKYHVGSLCGQEVVIAKAGIGKVLSAAGAAAMLNRYDVSAVLFTGIAGGVGDETRVLDVVIATDLVQHDYGEITNEGFAWSPEFDRGEERIPCDETLSALARDAAVSVVGGEHVFRGTVASGDQFVASEAYAAKLREDFGALACEMEGASVALVCERYGVPLAVIRTMSDKADGLAHETYANMADEAADNSCRIVMRTLQSMEGAPAADAAAEEPAAEPEGDVQYVLYLGTNDKDTNRPVFDKAEAMERAREILVRHFGGYTIQEAFGGWEDGGTMYEEYTLVIYLSDTTPEAVHAAADELVDTFRQSSVLIQTNPTRTEFYSGAK